ncbi:MAG TPA: PmoA family protein, partial [Eudoraea sp.]|nr:PmoA family protein [Eudoraea sp.]
MRRIFLFFLIVTAFSCAEDEIVRFKVREIGGISPSGPVMLNIEGLKAYGLRLEERHSLIKKENGTTITVPYKTDQEGRLWFVQNGGKASYYFSDTADSSQPESTVTYEKEDGNLQLAIDDRSLLTYRYGMTYPPQGVDSIFRKSGYVHPVITPGGDTLTRIQPSDHYHHYGIWGPWTHTQIRGQQVDFWNLGDGKGTVLFKKFISTTSGSVFGSFTAAQEHIDFISKKEPQVALNENLRVTLFDLNRKDRYMFDYSTTFRSPLENGILFEAYRYGGGIGMRFTERWKADNCSVLTSEGKDRLTADGTNARWCVVTG